VVCYPCISGPMCKQLDFHCANVDQRICLLNAQRSHRCYDTLTRTASHWSQTVQASLPWHFVDPHWEFLDRLCPRASLCRIIFQHVWCRHFSMCYGAPRLTICSARDNPDRSANRPFQMCRLWGNVGNQLLPLNLDRDVALPTRKPWFYLNEVHRE
jgi:hypothetical protein